LDSFLLGYPAISTGNTVIAISVGKISVDYRRPRLSVFETSDLPDWVVNVVTGHATELHEDARRT